MINCLSINRNLLDENDVKQAIITVQNSLNQNIFEQQNLIGEFPEGSSSDDDYKELVLDNESHHDGSNQDYGDNHASSAEDMEFDQNGFVI